MKKIALLFAVIFAMAFTARAQEMYVVVDNDNSTFTFYFDNNRQSHSEGDVYLIKDPAPGSEQKPEWVECDGAASVRKAVFDPSFANARPTSTASWFRHCGLLREIEGLQYLNTCEVRDMGHMFAYCPELVSLDLSGFDTRKVEDMSYMFIECGLLETVDLSSFNTSGVKNMERMFYQCCALLSLDLSNFDTRNVTNMSYMFAECWCLKTLDVSRFDTRNVTDMGMMFGSCSSLKTLDVSNFNTSKVTEMGGMFDECTDLTVLDVSHFDTRNVRDMACMFRLCESLTSLDVSNFNTSNLESIWHMFANVGGVKHLDLRGFNTSKVESFYGIFEGCAGLETLDLSSFDTSNGKDLAHLFAGCRKLKWVNLSSFDTKKITDLDEMFADCESLVALSLSYIDTRNVEKAKGMFKNCKSLDVLDMFCDFDSLKYADEMFSGCSKLTTIIAISAFPSTVNGKDMFKGCTSLVGGGGTRYDESHTGPEYAVVDNVCGAVVDYNIKGYFSAHSTTKWPYKVTLDYNSLYFYEIGGQSKLLTATLEEPGAARNKIYWLSTNPDVVSVNRGLLFANGLGEATIVAYTENGRWATCKVAVQQRQAVYPRSLSFTRPVFYLYEGESQKLEFELEPKYANQFTFTTTNPNIAEVSADGTVTAKQPGICRVIVQWTDPDGLSHNDVCRVEVSAR